MSILLVASDEASTQPEDVIVIIFDCLTHEDHFRVDDFVRYLGLDDLFVPLEPLLKIKD